MTATTAGARVGRLGGGRKVDVWVVGAFSLLVLIGLLWAARNAQFWTDEMYSIGVVHRPSLYGVIKPSTNLTETIPPLYYVLLWLWYRLWTVLFGAPVSVVVLLLPSAVCVAGSVFFTGLAAWRAHLARPAIWAVTLLCTASVFWLQCGLQVRYYGLQYLFAALAVYLYIVVRQFGAAAARRRRLAAQIALGAVFALAAYAGYEAIFWIASLAIVDVAVWVLAGRARGRGFDTLLSYVVSIILYLPWVVTVVVAVGRDGLGRNPFSFWPGVPGIHTLIVTYHQMLGYLGEALLVLAVIMMVVYSVSPSMRRVAGEPIAVKRFGWVFVVAPTLMVAMVFVYSRWINPTGSLFVARYFFLLQPMLCVAIGVFIDLVARMVRRRSARHVALVVSAVVLAASSVWSFVQLVQNPNYNSEPYQASAQYVLRQPDVRDASVYVVVQMSLSQDNLGDQNVTIGQGWYWYYGTNQGSTPGFNFASSVDAVPSSATKVYLCFPKATPTTDAISQASAPFTVVAYDQTSRCWTLQGEPSQ